MSETIKVEVDVSKLPRVILEQMTVLSAETGKSVPAMFGSALDRYFPKRKALPAPKEEPSKKEVA